MYIHVYTQVYSYVHAHTFMLIACVHPFSVGWHPASTSLASII